MASRKFRFVSPGVFLKEIDNSQLPGQAPGIGPVLIGRTRQGPAMKPYKIRSLEELERVFGKPMPGNEGEDPWREGTDLLAESFVPYAAKAYLSAEIDSPVTVVRLAGVAGEDAVAESDGEPGWKMGSAWGLFMFPSSSQDKSPSLTLAGIFYGNDTVTGDDHFGIKLKGRSLSGSGDITTTKPGQPVRFSEVSDRLTLVLSASSGTREVKFLASEIRKDFNTNPVSTNSRIMSPPLSTLASKYWLGETFDEAISAFESSVTGSCVRSAVALKLDSEMANFRSSKHGLTAARTGWLISQDTAMDNLNFQASAQQKLFRLVAIQEGSEASKSIMVGIEDIKIPRDGATDKYGTFSVVVKKVYSNKVEEVERFDNCSLNPASDRHVARQIGDQYYEWSTTEKRNKLYNTNPNISEYIRVDMDPLVAIKPPTPEMVPFGFLGPVVPKTLQTTSDGTQDFTDLGGLANAWVGADKFQLKTTTDLTASWPGIPHVVTASSTNGYYAGVTPFKRSYVGGHATTTTEEINPGYVDYVRRASEFENLVTDQDAGTADQAGSERPFVFTLDDMVLEASPAAALASTASISRASQVSSVHFLPGSKKAKSSTALVTFTGQVDDPPSRTIILTSTDGTAATYTSAGGTDIAGNQYSRLAGQSATGLKTLIDAGVLAGKIIANVQGNNLALTQSTPGVLGDRAIGGTLDADANASVSSFTGGQDPLSFSGHIAATASKSSALRPLTEIVEGFNVPMIGGFDGTNIREANPFNNNVIDGKNTSDSYAYASIDRAIELVKDPEAIEHNLAIMPGITNTTLTTKLVRACEARGDSMAIIDLPGVYVPPFENSCDNFAARIQTTPEKASAELVKRQLNSSYGAAYYPWVKIRDEQFGRDVWAPPSVVALGVMAYTEQRDEVWFAPAGFNRGGLNEGNAGVPVLQVSEQLMSRDRDTLYDANINPIASFVSEGLVVFGQKTLQSSQSALDRINVRRLLIFIKKEVSKISNNLLFEQNIKATWVRFTNQVVPFLNGIKTRFGLSDFRVILDDTTTTPELVDRNIMYAKILLKPARSIEFIAVDFVITNTGASFDD